MFRAYVTNLGKYNEGDLVGEWVDFPCDENEYEEVLKRISISEEPDKDGIVYEEVFITDYDGDFGRAAYEELGEYPTLDELNDFAEKTDELEELDKEYGEGFASSLVEEVGDIERVLDGIDDIDVIEGNDDSDVGYWYVDMFGDVSDLGDETIERYFDYEGLGRDLGFDSYEVENDDYDPDDPDSEEYIYVDAGTYWCGDENASDYEIGEEYVAQVGGIEGVANPENYFDYDGFGRDIRLESEDYEVTTDDYSKYIVIFH